MEAQPRCAQARWRASRPPSGPALSVTATMLYVDLRWARIMLGDQQSADPWNALSPTRQAGIRAISPWVDLGTFSVMMFLGFAVRDYVSTGQLTFWVVGTIIIALVRQVIWRRT